MWLGKSFKNGLTFVFFLLETVVLELRRSHYMLHFELARGFYPIVRCVATFLAGINISVLMAEIVIEGVGFLALEAI